MQQNNNNDNKKGVTFVQQDVSDKNCVGCEKKGHMLQNCPKLSDAEKKKIWDEKTADWTPKGTPRVAATKTGVNHLSTDDKDVEVVISVDTGSTSGLSSYAGASFQDYERMIWMVLAFLMSVWESTY